MLDFSTVHAQFFYNNVSNDGLKCWQLTGISEINADVCFPDVWVCVSQQGMTLNLSYFIEKNCGIVLQDLNSQQYTRKDFLWESNCLELFFELSGEKTYFEVNVNPTGSFNAYEFEDYRSPDVMPPLQALNLDVGHLLVKDKENWYIGHFDIRLNHHYQHFAHHKPYLCHVSKINPTVILYQDNEPIFYAVNHAIPPDFHNKHYWLSF